MWTVFVEDRATRTFSTPRYGAVGTCLCEDDGISCRRRTPLDAFRDFLLGIADFPVTWQLEINLVAAGDTGETTLTWGYGIQLKCDCD